MIEEIVCVMC